MKKILLIIIPILIVAFVILFVRPSKSVDKNLLLAEELMSNRPDSSLQILENMKVREFTGENKALYALLMTQAQFKNHITLKSDTLFEIAYDYYIVRNDSIHKAQVYYYRGRIYESFSNVKDAIRYYQKASTTAKYTNEYSFLSLIYSRWAKLLFKQNLFDDALIIQNKSLYYSIMNNDTLMQIHNYKDIGMIYSAYNKYSKAISYYNKAMGLANLINNTDCISSICTYMGYVYKCLSEYDKGLFYTNKSISLLSDTAYIYSRYSLKGDLFSLKNQYDSAKFYIELSCKKGNMISEASYCSLMSLLEEKLGNYKNALKFSKQYIDYISKIEDDEKENSLAELQKKYDYSLIKNENIQLELKNRNRNIFILTIIIISVIVVWIISYHYNRIRREKDEIIKAGNEQLKQMADILMEWEMKLKEVKLKSKEELDAFVKWVLSKNEAMKKIEKLAKMDTSEIIANKDELKLTPTEIENLKEVVDICFNSFATRLSQNFPNISEENIHYSCLLRMKVPASSIAILLGVTDSTLVKRKYRFKKEMIELVEGFSSLEEFLLNY